jgi:hypothetical protein
MIGKVLQLKYIDTNTTKFPELMSNNYLEMKIDVEMNMHIVELKVWAKGMKRVGLLNLLDIPHFCRSQDINACVNMLLTYVYND